MGKTEVIQFLEERTKGVIINGQQITISIDDVCKSLQLNRSVVFSTFKRISEVEQNMYGIKKGTFIVQKGHNTYREQRWWMMGVEDNE